MRGGTLRFVEDYDRRFSRATVLGVVFLFVFGALILRLYYLQCISQGRYRDLFDGQHYVSVKLAARRGPIRDARGNLLAVSVERNSVYVDPV